MDHSVSKDQANHSHSINPADRQNLNKSFDVFRAEVKNFWETKNVSAKTWFAFVFLIITNLVTIVYSATPSWGQTSEIVGQGGNYEGMMDGMYGTWYNCYRLTGAETTRRQYCELWTDTDYIPGWWPGYQVLMTFTYFFGFFTFLILAFYIFSSRYNKSVKIIIGFIVCSLLAALCSTAGCIMFCVLFQQEAYWCCNSDVFREILDYKLYWGFYLACVGTLMYYIVVVVATFEAVDTVREKKEAWDLEHVHQNGGIQGDDEVEKSLLHRSHHMY